MSELYGDQWALTLLISFVVTWTIGLAPPLLIRFMVLRRPSAKGWAIAIVAILWAFNVVLFTALGSQGKTHGVLVLIAFASYVILRKSKKPIPEPVNAIESVLSEAQSESSEALNRGEGEKKSDRRNLVVLAIVIVLSLGAGLFYFLQNYSHNGQVISRYLKSEKEGEPPITNRVNMPQDKKVQNSSQRDISTKEYTGEKIAVDYRGVDIRNVSQVFEQVSGFNFLVDNNVSCKVDLHLQKPQPWDKILDMVCQKYGLSAVRDGDFIVIKTNPSKSKPEKNSRIANLKKRINQNPRDYDAYVLLASQHINRNEYDRAIEILDSVLRKKPDHIEGHAFLGLAHVRAGEKWNAFQQCKELQRLSAPNMYNEDILRLLADGETIFKFRGQQGAVKFTEYPPPATMDLNKVEIIKY